MLLIAVCRSPIFRAFENSPSLREGGANFWWVLLGGGPILNRSFSRPSRGSRGDHLADPVSQGHLDAGKAEQAAASIFRRNGPVPCGEDGLWLGRDLQSGFAGRLPADGSLTLGKGS
jgi:hypothetical protein